MEVASPGQLTRPSPPSQKGRGALSAVVPAKLGLSGLWGSLGVPVKPLTSGVMPWLPPDKAHDPRLKLPACLACLTLSAGARPPDHCARPSLVRSGKARPGDSESREKDRPVIIIRIPACL